MRSKRYGRSIFMGILAGTIYGAWAIYANRNHDLAHVARAACVQFVLSFGSTAVLTLMIELVLARGRSLANLVLAAFGPHGAITVLFVVIHWLAGTPNIARTVAPTLSVGLVYAIVYVLKRSRAPQDEPPSGRVRGTRDAPGPEIVPS